MNPDLAIDYLSFVRERHAIWEKRQRGLPQPWTEDPILASRKFCCVFRLLDVGSQFVLGLLEPGLSERDTLMRAFLYRHTGRPEPWEWFELMHGRYPLVEDLELVRETWKAYRGGTRPHTSGSSRAGQTSRVGTLHDRSLFTSAYLVFPQSQTPGTDKLDSIIDLTTRLFTPGSPQDIMPDFLRADNLQKDRFAAIRNNPGVGDFMSFQVLTDWGYTTQDRENEFIAAGPGTTKGAAVVFPGKPARYAIDWAADQDLGVDLYGRRPSLADIGNTWCEFFKWNRHRSKPLVSKPYRPAHPGPQPAPVLPRNW